MEYFTFSRIENGYLLLNSLVKLFTDHTSFIFIVVALIINVLILKSIKTYTPYALTAILIYFVGFYLNLNFGLLRQGIAIGIFFYSLKYINSKEPFKYFILNIIACSFHISAIIVLPFYFILKIRLTKVIGGTLLLVSLLLSTFDWMSFFVNNYLPSYYSSLLNSERHGSEISLFSSGTLLKFLILGLGFLMKEKLENKYAFYNII